MAFIFYNKFGEECIRNDCPLDGGESGQVTVFHRDGSSDYYDKHGKLLEHRPAPEKTELQKQIEKYSNEKVDIKMVSIEEFMNSLSDRLDKKNNHN